MVVTHTANRGHSYCLLLFYNEGLEYVFIDIVILWNYIVLIFRYNNRCCSIM